MEPLEDKIKKEDKIRKSASGVIDVLIGLGMIGVGSAFDYRAVDDVLKWGGCAVVGWNAKEAINYVRYLVRGYGPTE